MSLCVIHTMVQWLFVSIDAKTRRSEVMLKKGLNEPTGKAISRKVWQ